MLSIVKILVVVAAALAISSGIWVAAALLRTLIHSDAGRKPPTEE